jgi:hypothetical protein
VTELEIKTSDRFCNVAGPATRPPLLLVIVAGSKEK